MKFGYIFFEMCEIAIRSYLIIMIMFCLFWLQLFSTIVPKDHRELRREEEEESDGRRQTSISVLPTPYLAYQTYLGPMSRLSVGILYPQKERLPRVSLATRVSRSIAVTTAKNGRRGEDVCFIKSSLLPITFDALVTGMSRSAEINTAELYFHCFFCCPDVSQSL